jgi:hypothetical protein
MESYDILLVILSVAFIISLVVWIFVGVLMVQILRKLRSASEKAQVVADNVEAFTAHLKSAGKATLIGSIIKQFTKSFRGGK